MRWLFMITMCASLGVAFPFAGGMEVRAAEELGGESLAREVTPSPGTDATATVRALLADMQVYRTAADGESLSDADRAFNAELTEGMHGYLDLDGLARRSLMGTWDEIGPPEQAAFRALLRDLFEGVTYPKSAEFFSDLDRELVGTREQGDKRVVSMEVSHPDEGLIEIDFYLQEVAGSWKVVEIDLDGASLALDIRAQMQKIIREHSYAELKRRIQEKLEKEVEPI